MSMSDHPFDHSKPEQASYSENGKVPPLSPRERDLQEPELAQRRREDVAVTQSSLKRLYIILLAVGIGLGAIVSVGVVLLLDRLDLIDPAPSIEQGEPTE
jgi:hypothetical protein